jgi:hypothetical protein
MQQLIARYGRATRHFILALCGGSLALGLSSLAYAQPTPQSAPPPAPLRAPSSPATPLLSALQLQSWRSALAKSPLPSRTGCFTAHYPSATWLDVPCVTPPNVPYRPVHSVMTAGRVSSVGNGNDYVAETGNLITSVTGSFQEISGVINEADGGQADKYALQLNTNFFYNTPACNKAQNPATCQGWEQFVYSNSGIAFIQYWLINYATTCPKGWNTLKSDCWKNAPGGAAYGPEPITSLSLEQVTASAGSSTDTIVISGPGGVATASNGDNVLSLANYWNNAEFNIVGDGNGSTANFNSGVTIGVRTIVYSGTSAAPDCAIAGTTGETNNTNLVAPCSAIGGSTPGIIFSESNPPGSIWTYTGTPCSGTSCTGWQELDDNNESVRIAATGTNLYQLWNNGEIWEYTGTPCVSSTCSGWKNLFNNPNTFELVAGGNQKYQLEDNGKLWQYIGGTDWRLLDDNKTITSMVAASDGVFELHNNGAVWQFTGTPCTSNSGTDCPGWQQLDNNSATVELTTGLENLYEMHNDGTIWKYTGVPCGTSSCTGWQMIANNGNAVTMVAGGNNLYELDSTGVIWSFGGGVCTGSSCPGWKMVDDNPAAIEIAADDEKNLYELHNDGTLWKYTGTPCHGSTCSGWQMIDDNPWTGRIAASSGKLYELHVIQVPPARANICYDCR